MWVKEAKELAEKPWWKWLPGMAYQYADPEDETYIHDERIPTVIVNTDEVIESSPPKGAWPNLSDWATIGIIEGMCDIDLVRYSSTGWYLKNGQKGRGGWIVQGGDIQVFAPTRGLAYTRLLVSQKEMKREE